MILVFLPRNGFNFHYYTDILIYTSVILLQYHLKNITGKHTSISNNKYFGMAEYLDDEEKVESKGKMLLLNRYFMLLSYLRKRI